MVAPTLPLTVDLDFLVIWSPIFLSHHSYQLDLSLDWVCLLKNIVFLNHQKPPGFTNYEFLRARATACICSKSSINTVIANSQLIIFEWNLICSFLDALMPTDSNSAVIWGLDIMCWDLKSSLLSERRASPRPSQCHPHLALPQCHLQKWTWSRGHAASASDLAL